MKIAADVAFLGPLGIADVSRMEFTPGVHGVDVSQTHCQHRQLGFTAFGRFVSVLQPVGAWSLVSGISNGSVTLSLVELHSISDHSKSDGLHKGLCHLIYCGVTNYLRM